jgi:hypothetical protein
VHWFRRPPYFRWAAAALIVLIAFISEASGSTTVAHPFVRNDTAAGAMFSVDHLEWRQVTAGALAMPDLSAPLVAAHDLTGGDPLLPSSLGSPVAVPSDWWAVPTPLPEGTTPGDPVRLVILDPLLVIDGIVVAAPLPDAFAYEAVGLVAVPGDLAPTAAAAAAYNGVVALLHP